jgi:hypothetical protein
VKNSLERLENMLIEGERRRRLKPFPEHVIFEAHWG